MVVEGTLPRSDGRRPWQVGVTDKVRPPFDFEDQGLRGTADLHFFDAATEADLQRHCLEDLDALLIWTPHLGQETAARLAAGRCRIVVRYGVGYDRIDRAALARHGIAFSNNPDYGCEEVADTAIAMLLSLLRRVPAHDVLSRDYRETWQGNVLPGTTRLRGLPVGVVGLGRIGTAAALRLRAFGCRVIAYDPYVASGIEKSLGIERCDDLAELAENCAAVTLHCVLTDETRGIINAGFLGRLGPGAVLVNTARGALVKDLDLLQAALAAGTLYGVGIDALAEEPPGPHPLIEAWRAQAPWLAGRILINPHNAFYSDSAWTELRIKAAETAWLMLEKGIHRNGVSDAVR